MKRPSKPASVTKVILDLPGFGPCSWCGGPTKTHQLKKGDRRDRTCINCRRQTCLKCYRSGKKNCGGEVCRGMTAADVRESMKRLNKVLSWASWKWPS